jgi:hypothetical protein
MSLSMLDDRRNATPTARLPIFRTRTGTRRGDGMDVYGVSQSSSSAIA